MKQLFFAVLLLPTFTLVDIAPTLADISRALGAGNADELGQYFDQSVEVAILDEEDVYDKARAVQVVKQFFSRYQAKSFSQVHQGVSKGSDAQYCIGNLVTSNGTFRVYLYMKVTGGKFLIQEMRFDKQ